MKAVRNWFVTCFLSCGFLLAVLTVCEARLSQGSQSAPTSLTPKEAIELIENLPEVRFARDRFDRPLVQVVESSQDTISLVARSTKTRGYASGLIGHYEVDRQTGRIWRDIDRQREATSFLVQTLRQNFLSATPEGSQLQVPSLGLLQVIKQAKTARTYSIFGATLGRRLNIAEPRPNGITVARLLPDPALGQMLSGFELGGAGMPLIEAYDGPDDVIMELYVETSPSRESMSALFGKEFTDALSSIEPDHWKVLLGPDVLIGQSQFQNITALFADNPTRGFCACVYRRVLPIPDAPAEIEPIFVDFYIPNRTPTGETLTESIRRRMVTCLQQTDLLDR